jgi:hypothetical protein
MQRLQPIENAETDRDHLIEKPIPDAVEAI